MLKIKAIVVQKLKHVIMGGDRDYDYFLELNVDDIIEVLDMETHWIYEEKIHENNISIRIESHFLIIFEGDRLPNCKLQILVDEKECPPNWD